MSAERLSGQLAAWHAEHLNFARLLRLFEEQVALFAAGESPDYALMQDIVYYLQHFPDVHHHRYETEVFQRMAERDATLKTLAERLVQEHRVIAAAGARLASQLESVVDGAVVPRADLEAASATYLVYYRAHLDAEESVMLPRAGAMFSAADWADVARMVAERSRDDPLFGPRAEERFRELRLRIEREAAGAAVAAH
jgi:hemerythrin-like domain-containing protein